MKKYTILFFILLIICSLLINAYVYANGSGSSSSSSGNSSGGSYTGSGRSFGDSTSSSSSSSSSSLTNDFRPTEPSAGTVDMMLQNKTKDIWATVVVLVQIASVAAVVFAGLRYMFASADQRADIKKGLIYLSIGAVLVFGATLIINLVVSGFNEIM